MYCVLRLFQRRRKRKKQEQVVQNESGEGVKMALIGLSTRFYFKVYATEDVCHATHQDEDEGAGVDSELDESESEAEASAEDLKMRPHLYSYVTTADMAPGIRGCQKAKAKSSEEVGHCVMHVVNFFEMLRLSFYVNRWIVWPDFIFGDFTFCVQQEPGWDVSSAFFTNAASHSRSKGLSRRSKENKENEARREVSGGAVITG